MPRGTYTLRDPDGTAVAIESFSTAPGPMGWRYYASVHAIDDASETRVDVSVDAGGRPVRIRIESPEHALLLAARGERLEGDHDGDPVDLPYPPGTGVFYGSPGFLGAALHRLEGDTELAIVAIDPTTLAPSPGTGRCARGGEEAVTTPVGVFDAVRWSVDGRVFWLAGTVAVAADDGWFELTDYEPGATGPAPRLRSL